MLSISTTAAERPGEAKAVSAACPRCGYDQRGIVETWRESCPIDGTCSECGLEYAWGELMNPRLLHPRWCVEHRGGAVRFVRQAFGTLVRTCWPWSLWSGLRMTHEPRWRRIAAYLLVLLLGVAVLIDVAAAVLAVANWRAMNIVAPGATLTATGTARDVFLNAALNPFSNAVPPIAVSISMFARSTGFAPSTSGLTVGANPAFVTRTATWTMSAQPPRLATRQILERAAPLAMLGLTPPFMAAAFATLPVSRRRAKVKWSHIGRAMLYSMALVPASIAILMAVSVWSSLMDGPGAGQQLDAATFLLAMAFIPLQAMFWAATAGRYLKMQHAWAVAISVAIIGLLCPFALGSLIVNGL